jgi:hypothetical protein
MVLFKKLQWFKDNEPIMISSRLTTNYEPITGDIEMNIDFVRPFDEGTYLCKAENKYGMDQTMSKIEIVNVPDIDENPQTLHPDKYKNLEQPFNLQPIEEKEQDKGKPPKFIIHLPAEVKLHDGVKFKTRCKVEGYPLPRVNLKIL